MSMSSHQDDDPNLAAAANKLAVAASRRFDNAFCWKVEFTSPDPTRGYTMNKSVSVICKTIDAAVAQVYRQWPQATIIKAFRGDRWGNEGVIVVDEGLTA